MATRHLAPGGNAALGKITSVAACVQFLEIHVKRDNLCCKDDNIIIETIF